MPNIKSAAKALRQSQKRKARNLKRKEAVRGVTKEIKKLLAAGEREKAMTIIPKAYQAIDKATKTYLHQRTAARKKSRLMKLVISR